MAGRAAGGHRSDYEELRGFVTIQRLTIRGTIGKRGTSQSESLFNLCT
jgi:hypothetical protein